jgi:GAF domain-containing protein
MTRAEKVEKYSQAQLRMKSTLADEQNPITVMATVVAILKESFAHFYWAGFLLVEGKEMALGPFQGPPACVRLPLNSTGVCGTCYRTAQPVLVPDVAAFQGRIGCDVISKSEIAVPIVINERVAAILDIDSDELRGVDDIDKAELEQVASFVASRIGLSTPGVSLSHSQ